jgi:hypothetical protein
MTITICGFNCNSPQFNCGGQFNLLYVDEHGQFLPTPSYEGPNALASAGELAATSQAFQGAAIHFSDFVARATLEI